MTEVERIATQKYQQLLHCAQRIVHNTADAEDAVQEGLCLAWQHRHECTGAAWEGWVWSCVCNHARAIYRRRLHLWPQRYAYLQPKHSEGALSGLLLAEQRHLLRSALWRLPKLLGSSARLVWLQGLNDEQAAQRLGITLIAHKCRLHRARLVLRKTFQGWEGRLL